MKPIQNSSSAGQTRGSRKPLSIFLAMMVLATLFLSVAPVGAVNTRHVVCKEVCSKTLGPITTGINIEDRTIVVRKVVHHKTIRVEVHQVRTCQTKETYKVCVPMTRCVNTGCSPGSPYVKIVSSKTKCGSWHNVC